ncbi:MAG: histidine triad nucleotide-binding protein [Fibrobacteres bacterium]|nr:histidine triad nucleotide-binding protein [Fibrobacterota bacterium]
MSDCLFCKIINGDIPAKKIHETPELLVFHDIAPKAPFHALVIPKKHITSLNELTVDDEKLIGSLFTAAKKVAADGAFAEKGYRVVFNCGADGGQTVGHLHMHLLGGRSLEWPPG